MTNNNPFMTGAIPNASMPTPMPTAGSTSPADNFEIDLSSVSDGFTIPDGTYKIKCTEIEQNVSQSGNPMFVWTFEIADGQYKGFQLKSFTAITPAAMWKVAETVEALGVGQKGSVVKFKRTDVLNKECGALVEQAEYNGRVRSQITRVMSLKEFLENQN